MSGSQDRSFVSSVVFLEFAEYTKKPVAEQIAIKERFNALLAEALTGIPASDRIVLDASDGAAISFVGDPEDALFVAMRLRDAVAAAGPAPKIDARIGINIGAVKLVKHAHGQPNIIGDGIDVAQRVMSFAEPSVLLASRAFYELVSVLSQDYAELFKFEGARTDHQIREHQLYRVGVAARDLRGPGGRPGGDRERARKIWLMAGAAAAAILALALGLRLTRAKPAPPPEPPPPVEAPAAAPPAAAAPEPEAIKAPKPKVVNVKPKPAAAPAPAAATPSAPAPAAPANPGTINFAIAPWGEVYVDGAKRGVSPPLREVQIAPGKHTIEVRNTSFPSYNTQVEVTSGGQANIRYKFQ